MHQSARQTNNSPNGVPTSATGQADINPLHAVEQDSDFSSDELSLDIPLRHHPNTTSDPKEASVSHRNISRPPIMSNGGVTPSAVQLFEFHCENFFMNAKGGITDGQKVTRLFGSFKNPLINDWISCERTTLATLSFPEFMKEFRRLWLPTNWENAVKAQVLGSRLDPSKDKFEIWVAHVQTLNATLRGTSSHLNNEQLLLRLEVNLDEDLRLLVYEEKAYEIRELLPWIQKVRDIDNRRHNDRKRIQNYLEERMQAINNPSVSVTRSSSRRSATIPNPFPPPLTNEERRLLREHDGCFKCRTFFAGHTSDQCTVKLSGKGYKPLNTQDVLRAKISKGIA
jgi:hypothetical protein